MKLPLLSWNKTIRNLGYRVIQKPKALQPPKTKLRKREATQQQYGSLEPRQMMAGVTGLTAQADLDQLLQTLEDPIVVKIGQLDDDATFDAVVLSSSGQLSLAANSGSNRWQTRTTTDLGVGPLNGMELALVDGDEFADLILQGPDGLFVAINDGQGDFGVSQALPINGSLDFGVAALGADGNNSLRIIANDLNGDFSIDIVAIAPGSNQAVIYFGVGDGTFSPATVLPTGGDTPTSITAGDFVGNALPDIAIGHRDGSISFFQNVGDGDFDSRDDLRVEGFGSIADLVSEDLDNDGDSEIVVSDGQQLTILQNQQFETATGPVLENGTFSRNLSGWNTEIVGHQSADEAGSVIAQSGFAQLNENRSFLVSINQDFTVPTDPRTIEFDILAMGLEDPAGGIPDAFEVSILGADGESLVPTFADNATSFFNVNPGDDVRLAPGVTFDGSTVSVDISSVAVGAAATIFFDLIGNQPGNQSTVTVDNVRVTPDGDFDSSPFSPVVLDGPFSNVRNLAIADVDGDGKLDIAATDEGSGQLLVFNGRGLTPGDLTFDREEIGFTAFGIDSNSGLSSLASGPLTQGDAVADLVVVASNTNVLISPLAGDNDAPLATLTAPVNAETSSGDINRIEIGFSEPLQDAGADGLVSVTNPDNYSVVFSGPDGVAGTNDDTPVVIDGVSYNSQTNIAALSVDSQFAPLPDGLYTVTLNSENLIDASENPLNDGQPVTLTFNLNAFGPEIAPLSISSNIEGSVIELSTTFTDDGGSGPYRAIVDWGDGTTSEVDQIDLAALTGSINTGHVYADNGTYTISLTVSSSDGLSSQVFGEANVANQAPDVTVENSALEIQVGDTISGVLAQFTDAGFDNPAAPVPSTETFAATIDWGDGTEIVGTVESVSGTIGAPTTGTVSGSHTFSTAGTFTVVVTISDDDGGQNSASFQVIAVGDQVDQGAWLPQIDFDTDADGFGLSSGTVIGEQWADWGVHITTLDPFNHPAMIFDSSHPTGRDTDLGTPNVAFGGPGIGSGGDANSSLANSIAQRNILIISEDGNSSDPDDNAAGGTLVFDFDVPVMLDEIGLLDIDSGESGMIRLYASDGSLILSQPIVGGDNNSYQRIDLSATNVARLEVELSGSGAITDLLFCRDAHNQATATISGEAIVNEGAVYELSLNESSSAQNDLLGWFVNWGDGTTQTVTGDNSTAQHTYDGSAVTSEVIAWAYLADGSVHRSNTLNVEIVSVTPESLWLPRIDFEYSAEQIRLRSGDVIADQFASLGVHVTTNDPVNHPAMIFNSASPTGGDQDLGTPNAAFGGPGVGAGQGNDVALDNVLIISEDGDSSDPDDNLHGGTLIFTFDDAVMLDEIGLLDIDRREAILRVFGSDGDLISQIRVNGKGNNSFQTVAIDAIGVMRLEVEFAGSGAITELVFCRDSHDTIEAPPTKFFTVDASNQGFQYAADGQFIDQFGIDGGAVPRGITTTPSGNPVWVVKSNEIVSVYDRQAGTFEGAWYAKGPQWARGIATDGDDIWIVDARNDRIYAYQGGAEFTSGRRDFTDSFQLHRNNGNPSGLAYHGGQFWVSDASSDRVFVYTEDGSHLGNWRLDGANGRSSGITTDATGQNLWVTDYVDGEIYFYANATGVLNGSLSATSTIALAADNRRPEGIADPAIPVNLDQVVTGTIATAGEQFEYSFDVSAGEKVFFDVQGGSAFFRWNLVSPSGSQVFRSTFSDRGAIELTEAGTYILTVGDASNTRTGDYSFRLWDVPQNVPTTVELGNVTSGDIGTPGENVSYSFNATAGENVSFDVLSGSAFFGWNLVSPSGDQVFFSSTFRDQDTIELPETGSYILTVGNDSNSRTGTFSFQTIIVPDAEVRPLVLGAETTGTLEQQGGRDVWTFSAEAGQDVYLDVTGVSDRTGFALTDSNGQTVFSTNVDFVTRNLDRVRIPLPTTGDYQLEVRSDIARTPDYSFIFDFVPDPDVNTLEIGDYFRGGLETLASVDQWNFTGFENQQIFIDFLQLEGGFLDVELLSPTGDSVYQIRQSSTAQLDSGLLTLPSDGQYTINIEQGLSDPAEFYELRVVDIPIAAPIAIDFEQLVAGDIDLPGQTQQYTFDADAGTPLTVGLAYNGIPRLGAAIGYTLTSPTGVTLIDAQQQDQTIDSLPESGSYTLTFAHTSGSFKDLTGEFNFQIAAGEDAPFGADAANLVVSSIVNPQSVVGNPASVEVTWTVTNQGNTITQTGTWVDRVVLSADGSFNEVNDFDDQVFGDFAHTGALAPGESYTQTGTITLPEDFDGEFEIVVLADAANNVFENADEGDNFLFSDHRTAVYPADRNGDSTELLNVDVATNSIFPAGETLNLSGQATTLAGATNLIFIIDVSGSAYEIEGLDANFDGVVDEADDLNNDGSIGSIVDAEIAAVIASIEQATQQSDNVQVASIIFSGGGDIPDHSPNLFNQTFVVPTADGNGNGIADFEETLKSNYYLNAVVTAFSGTTEFRETRFSDGTDFNTPLEFLTGVLDRQQDVDQTKVFFLTDGQTEDVLDVDLVQVIADADVEFNAFQITGNAVTPDLQALSDQIGSGSSVANATLVTNANDLTTSILATQNVTSVTVNGTPVELLDGNGNFSTPVTLQPGQNTFTIESFSDAGLLATETVTLIGDTGAVFDITNLTALDDIQESYVQTTFNRHTNQLHTGIVANNISSLDYAAPIAGVVESIDTTAVSLAASSSEGVDADENDYVVFDSELDNSLLASGQSSDVIALSFDNPLRQRFAVDVDFLVQPNIAPIVTSTPVLVAPADTVYEYSVSAIDLNGDNLSFQIVSGPSGLSLDTTVAGIGLLTWEPTSVDVGNHQVAVLIEDGRGGSVEHQFDVLVPSELDNQAPLILSQPDRLATVDEVFEYLIDAVDPEGDDVLLALGEDTPAGVSLIGNQLAFTPSEQNVGPQSLTVIASDSQGATSRQTFEINVKGINVAPEFISTPVTDAISGANYLYKAVASDADDTVTYSLISGPDGLAIDATSGRVTWQPDAEDIDGAFDVTIEATDQRGLSTSQSFTIAVTADTQTPLVSIASENSVLNIGETYRFQVNTTDNVGVDTIEATINGDVVALDSNRIGTFVASEAGFVNVVATVTDINGNVGTDQTRARTIDPTDTTAPFAEIVSPVILDTVTYLTDVFATVTSDGDLDTWSIDYSAAGSDNWVLLAEGTEDFTGENVATFDPTLLANNAYDLRITASDFSGNQFSIAQTIFVDSQAKLGNYAIEFTDLQIPLAGIPITITRQYDTLNANVSEDFGYGWKLAIGQSDIRESIPVGENEAKGVSALFGGSEPLFAGAKVFITTPEGQRVGFTFEPEARASLLGTIFTPKFTSEDTDYVLDTPNVNLSQSADGTFGLFPFNAPYNPRDYTLVSQDQIRYNYDQFDGLQTVVDRNGVTLEYRDDGIFSSTGESIEFVRDAVGRITQIVDPAGNVLNYQYNAAGDLVGYTDQVDNTWTHEYRSDAPHFLERITGPRGNVLNEVKYDEDGRFVALVDGLGNEVTQDFDVENNTFTTTDRNGNVTTLVYDNRGNITTETDALGGVTLYEYNDARNPRLETAITDANGNTTRFEYDARSNVTLLEEPGGVFTRFEYDSFNNVTRTIGPATSDPGDGFADSLIDSSFAEGFVLGTTIGERLVDVQNGNEDSFREFDPLAILGPEFDRDTETENRSDYILLAAGDSITVGFDEVVTDRPGADLFVVTPLFSGNFESFGEMAEVYVTTDGTNYVLAATIGLEAYAAVDLADNNITGNVLGVRIVALGSDDGNDQNDAFAITGVQTALSEEFRVTRNLYDANGNLVENIDALGNSSLQTNDEFGRPLTITDRRGNTTTLEYGQLIGSPTKVTNPDLTTQEFTYDDLGRPLTQTNELGIVVQTITYDDLGRRLSASGADGQLTTFEYDGELLASETVTINATQSQVTLYEYDDNNRLFRQIDGIGALVELTYDANGNTTSLTDPVGNVTSYVFDELNRQVEETDPLGQITTYAYDAVGNLTEKVDRLDRRIEFQYDEMDRQTAELWYTSDGTLIETSTYTYDIFSNLLTASDAESSYTYTYDVLDRLLTSDNAGTPDAPNVILNYTYDVDGNRTRVADNSGVTIDSEYGSRNQLLSKTWFGGEVDDARIEYDYDLALRETEARRYSDTDGTIQIGSTETVYDDTGRRVRITHLDGSDIVLANYEYEFDQANRITQQTIDDDVVDYTYDATGQLLTADHSDPSIPDEFYVYDLNGNRIESHLHGSDYVTGPNNQLLSDGEFNYEYDDEGNQVRRTNIATGEVTEFEYDHRNRLIRQVEKSSGGIITSESQFVFDVFGRRIAVINDADGAGPGTAVRENFVYDGDNVWADYNEAGEAIARYLFGDSIDSNIARWRSGEGTAWYLTDHLGTVRALTGAVGTIVNQTTYDSFGQVLNETDALFGDRYKFTGRELNSGSDYYYRARQYSASSGRFGSLDPIRFDGGDSALYRYVQNSPAIASDPNGTVAVVGRAIFAVRTFIIANPALAVGVRAVCIFATVVAVTNPALPIPKPIVPGVVITCAVIGAPTL